MEKKVDLTSKAVVEILARTTEYLQPNPGKDPCTGPQGGRSSTGSPPGFPTCCSRRGNTEPSTTVRGIQVYLESKRSL
ncbi:hypothetical protein JRQ81_008873 [Phrynocephalus forsythii]|uniref:Uncharacterized protein n=1 Tax=Phrynocephalus forsythii TaxID=171643 RepID=A0A9Q0XBD4_9SAUR|nr:hypothetical protein JRQ81_008873 [Phrynocephalus forsythii]